MKTSIGSSPSLSLFLFYEKTSVDLDFRGGSHYWRCRLQSQQEKPLQYMSEMGGQS